MGRNTFVGSAVRVKLPVYIFSCVSVFLLSVLVLAYNFIMKSNDKVKLTFKCGCHLGFHSNGDRNCLFRCVSYYHFVDQIGDTPEVYKWLRILIFTLPDMQHTLVHTTSPI
jgi:hypothetical protein